VLALAWLHNGMAMDKMSKSLGNFITIRELLDRPTDPMAVRLFVLQAQYQSRLILLMKRWLPLKWLEHA